MNAINVYAGLNQNAELSNLSFRFFTFKGKTFNSVEQAYQYSKAKFFGDNHTAELILKESKFGKQKKLGNLARNYEKFDWNKHKYMIMQVLIRESLIQNPRIKEVLIDTYPAKITHEPERSSWKTDFPKILMNLREEFINEKKTKDTSNQN